MNLILNINRLKASGVWLQMLLSVAASLSTISDGMSIGWIAQKIAEMTHSTSNSTAEISLDEASTIGILHVYALPIIVPLCIISTDHLGRKWTIIGGSLCTFSSWMIFSLIDKIEYIYAGAVFRGIGSFVIYAVIPIYIAEISQADIRGLLCTIPTILMNLGILLGYTCISFLSSKNVAIIGAVIIALMFPCFVFAPPSPYFLLLKNKDEKANKYLQKLRGTTDITSEIDNMKAVIETNKNMTLKEFFTNKRTIKICLISLFAIFFQQFSGINNILYFLEVIIHEFDSSISANMSNISFGVGKFIACGIALLLIDKLGRRILMITSCAITSCVLFFLGLYFYLKDIHQTDISLFSWLPLTLLIIYVFGFDFGLSPIPLIISSEIFPIKFKSYGGVISQLFYVIFLYCVTKLFTLLKDIYGFYIPFWTLAVLTIGGIFFTYFFLLETKGKTLNEILKELE